MPLTFDAISTIEQKAVHRVVSHIWDVNRSLPFDSSYLTADSYGNKYLYPGMLVSFNEDKDMYVPFSAAGSYGSYSSYLEGILYFLYDFTYQDQIVAPASRCAAVEHYCYVYGGTMGDIPEEAKSGVASLSGVFIQWD